MGKIKYLIEHEHIKEDEILCISFTNETVSNLYSKLKDMGYEIEVKTFHRLGLKFLENRNYSIIEDNYLEYIIDEYFKSFIKYNKKRVRILKNMLFTETSIDKILKSEEYKYIKELISTFIRLAKCNNYSLKDIYNVYKLEHFNNKLLLHNILDIYMIYIRELESLNKIDFDDMIIKAIDDVKYFNLKYKYIIIDEFQDTSMIRYDLIKEIVKYTNAKVFVVGDDWQSIYRFSGCNLNLFINFNKYFEDCGYYYLKYTYRNSNSLIKLSSSFIMKNKKQLGKSIVSNKDIDFPVVILFEYTVEEVLNMVGSEDTLILGRNNSDIKDIEYENKLTIHRSKGLEAENVILVNSDSIPNTIKNEDILKYVLNDKDYVLYEEERRLFYVALTRTKNRIFIMVNKRISPFVKELIHNYKDYIRILKKR